METDLPSAPPIDNDPHPVAIVASRYNARYTDGLVAAAEAELGRLLPNAEIDIYRVPGAFEIPVVIEQLCHSSAKRPAAVIALGVIIRGSTAHADLIARSITDSLARSAHEHRIPVIHEVLLVSSEAQAEDRSAAGSPINRGTEAARAAAEMIQLFKTLPER